MSEAAETLPQPPIANAMLGAASPLWGYFAGAAMGGVAFWWAARFVQPASYESLFARLPAPEPRSFAEPDAAPEAPFVAMAEAVASSPSAVVEAVPEAQVPAANDLTTHTA